MDGMKEREVMDAVRGIHRVRIDPTLLHFHPEDNVFTAEASTLGFETGRWPITLLLELEGQDLRFVRGREIRSRGEFAGYDYDLMDGVTRASGYTIRVFND